MELTIKHYVGTNNDCIETAALQLLKRVFFFAWFYDAASFQAMIMTENC